MVLVIAELYDVKRELNATYIDFCITTYNTFAYDINIMARQINVLKYIASSLHRYVHIVIAKCLKRKIYLSHTVIAMEIHQEDCLCVCIYKSAYTQTARNVFQIKYVGGNFPEATTSCRNVHANVHRYT